MKKKILFGILGLILTAGATTTGIVLSQADYSLNTEYFDNEFIFEENFNTEGLVIVKESVTGIEEINVTTDMIVSDIDTNTVGNKTLTIEYKNEVFTVDYTVKYQVNFYVLNDLVSTQNVFTMDELSIPEDPFILGYEFEGWSPEVPSTISDNMDFDAKMVDFETKIPVLLSKNATYGDLLSSIELPSNEYGRWVFTQEEGTTVGNAGTNRFDVEFIPTNEQQDKVEGIVIINVAKKEVEFKNLVTEFTYDGTAKKPTFTLDVEVAEVSCLGEGTDVGEYIYSISIKDDNYKGSIYGKFEIKAANVTINVQNKEIKYMVAIQAIEYEVIGIDEKYLNITTITPNVPHAGIYYYSVIVNNDNVNVTINGGKLTVNTVDFDEVGINIPNPEATITYGDKLSDIVLFNDNPNGVWSWDNPELIIDDTKEEFSFDEEGIYYDVTLRFTPKSTVDYNEIVRVVKFKLQKKELTINIIKNEYNYVKDTDYSIEYQIENGEYDIYDLKVLGNVRHTNAKLYNNITLSIDDIRYTGTVNTYLRINKSPYPYADFSEIKYGEWNSTLASVVLPEGYEWIDPTTVLTNIGETIAYKAKYVPEDMDNYLEVAGEFNVTITKASGAEIEVLNNANTFTYTYTGLEINISNLFTAKNTDSSITLKYELNNSPVENILIAGTYKVYVNLPETDYYYAAEEKVITIVVNPTKDIALPQPVEAIYGDNLGMFELPYSEYGVWRWKDGNDTLVGDHGDKHFVAIFEPTNNNYDRVEYSVPFKVEQRVLYFDIIENTYTYDGFNHSIKYALYLDKECTIKFEDDIVVSGNNEYKMASTYTINLVVVDEKENYIGSLSTSLIINRQKVALPSIDETVYTYNGSEQTYKIEESDLYTISGNKKINADTYFVTIALKDPVNYIWENGLETIEPYQFVINQKPVNEPTVIDTYEYTGKEIIAELQGFDSKYMTIKGNTAIDADDYEIEVTLDNNYTWAEGSDGIINWTINPMKIDVEWSTANQYTYNGKELSKPTALYSGVSIDVVCDKDEFIVVGSYNFTASTENTNYFIKNPNITIDIEKGKAEIDVDITPIIKTYSPT
ncbi:MAG: hypothetical protein J6R47_04465 [Acholeplasmatales bacterium]|nr:hypothetical protein [Acholeplasmatales bacterium]